MMVLIVADMLLALLRVCSEEELSEPVSEPGTSAEDMQRRRDEIKRKIRAVGKMQRVYQILRLVAFVFIQHDSLVHDHSCSFSPAMDRRMLRSFPVMQPLPVLRMCSACQELRLGGLSGHSTRRTSSRFSSVTPFRS